MSNPPGHMASTHRAEVEALTAEVRRLRKETRFRETDTSEKEALRFQVARLREALEEVQRWTGIPDQEDYRRQIYEEAAKALESDSV